MSCVAPPELEEVALLQAVDGHEVSSEIIEHLERCAHCRNRRDRLSQEQATLQARLFRIDCPSAEALSDLQAGKLSNSDAEPVLQHISGCVHCRAEIEFLRDFSLNRSAGGEQRRVKLIIGKKATADLGRPAGLPLRSGREASEQAPIVFETPDYRISLSTQQDPGAPARRAVYGLLSGENVEGWVANLIHGADLIERVRIDQHGNFVFRRLHPGSYELTLSHRDHEIVLQAFELVD